MGIGFPVDGEGWCKILIGEEGKPHGVEGRIVVTGWKPGSDCRPVPPITAIETGAVKQVGTGSKA